MTFPFSVRFSRALRTVITAENKEQVLQYVETSILERKADNVVVDELSVSYKGSTSMWKTALFNVVDGGTFYMVNKNDQWYLEYQINMHKMFIATSVMSTGITLFMLFDGGPWWFGLLGFLWLCGANWAINVVRHDSLATDIASAIDVLFGGKPEEPEDENDKMTGELKSWF